MLLATDGAVRNPNPPEFSAYLAALFAHLTFQRILSVVIQFIWDETFFNS